MQWHNVGDFLAMGGYAVYVWGSVGACAVAMLIEPVVLKRQHRALVRSLQPKRGGSAGGATNGARGFAPVRAEGSR